MVKTWFGNKSLRDNFEPGDIIFGLSIDRTPGVDSLDPALFPRRTGKKDNILIQNPLTDAVYGPQVKPDIPRTDAEILNDLNDGQRGLGFKKFASSYPPLQKQDYLALEGDVRANRLWKRTSKAGLLYQIFERKKTVHFCVDHLETAIGKIAKKQGVEGNSVTATEIRLLYRYRHHPDIRKYLKVYSGNKEISVDAFFANPLWNDYIPHRSYYQILGTDDAPKLAAEGFDPVGTATRQVNGNLVTSTDLQTSSGFVPYIKPGGKKYVYFPLIDKERVVDRLIPLLEELKKKNKPPYVPVFKDSAQVKKFKGILTKNYGPADNSTLAPEYRYLYTIDKTNLSDLDKNSTLYISGHSSPGETNIYNAGGFLAPKRMSSKQLAENVVDMGLPPEVTVKMASCDSAVGNKQKIEIPPSLFHKKGTQEVNYDEAYSYVTDPARMGPYDASLAGDFENELLKLQPGRESGIVYGTVGLNMLNKIEIRMAKIVDGQLIDADTTHSLAVFYEHGSANMMEFRKSDMMRGRFYDPNPMLGKHGLPPLPEDAPHIDTQKLAASDPDLEPRVSTAVDLDAPHSLIQAKGRPSDALFLASGRDGNVLDHAKGTVWENSLQSSKATPKDVLLFDSGAGINIDTVIKSMNNGDLRQYSEVSGYFGTALASFIKIVRHVHEGENRYEITVETLESQPLTVRDVGQGFEDPEAIKGASLLGETVTEVEDLNFKQLQDMFNSINDSQQWGNWVQSHHLEFNQLFEQMADGGSEIFQEYRSGFNNETATELWFSVKDLQTVRADRNSTPKELEMAFNRAVTSLSSALRSGYQAAS